MIGRKPIGSRLPCGRCLTRSNPRIQARSPCDVAIAQSATVPEALQAARSAALICRRGSVPGSNAVARPPRNPTERPGARQRSALSALPFSSQLTQGHGHKRPQRRCQHPDHTRTCADLGRLP